MIYRQLKKMFHTLSHRWKPAASRASRHPQFRNEEVCLFRVIAKPVLLFWIASVVRKFLGIAGMTKSCRCGFVPCSFGRGKFLNAHRKLRPRLAHEIVRHDAPDAT